MNYGRMTYTGRYDNREQLVKQPIWTSLDKVRDDIISERGNRQA